MFFRRLVQGKRQTELKISVVGGSNSVMRKGYAKYLDNYLSQAIAQTTSIKYYSLGGVPNIFGTIQEDRYDIAANSDLIFFEYCVNDRHAIELDHYSQELAGKSLEGFIKKCQRSNPYCLIVLLIFGLNKESYYQQPCGLSELYESIGQHYRLPIVNLTKLLTEQQGLNFIKSLYNEKDEAHYSRPEGVKVVAQTIVKQLEKVGITNSLKSDKNSPRSIGIRPVYRDNFEKLTFFEDFEQSQFFKHPPKVSIYQNSVFREKNFTITQGNSLQCWLKGQLVAIYLKSDLSDGIIEINHGEQCIVTSSYSEWVNPIRSNNLNLITLPLRRFEPTQDYAPLSIACCPEYPANFELDYIKQKPKKTDPQKWKLNIIGIAYLGELKPWKYLYSHSE